MLNVDKGNEKCKITTTMRKRRIRKKKDNDDDDEIGMIIDQTMEFTVITLNLHLVVDHLVILVILRKSQEIEEVKRVVKESGN